MWASWAESTKKSTIEKSGKEVSHSPSYIHTYIHTQHINQVCVVSTGTHSLTTPPADTDYCWLPGKAGNRSVPQTSACYYGHTCYLQTPFFLGGAPSHPRGRRYVTGRHPTGGETEKCGTFPQDTQQCSLSPGPSGLAVDIASSTKASWTAITALSALCFRIPPLLHPTEGYFSVGGWARRGAPTWSMVLCQSLDKHWVQLILTATI